MYASDQNIEIEMKSKVKDLKLKGSSFLNLWP